MKPMITLCFLFLILSFIDSVFSYSSDKSRLYDIIRKSMSENDNTRLLNSRIHKHAHPTATTSADQQSNSVENQENPNVQKRDSWDSGEDQYFKWASLNRRPMESLVGRKRLAETIVPRPSRGRISGGIWRSGLVG